MIGRINSNTKLGIYLRHSSNINTQNAYDGGANTWDSGTEGSYYSDYNGTDNNTDGIGDTPYPPASWRKLCAVMQSWTDTLPQKGDLNSAGILTPADAAIALEIAAGGSASCDAATLAAADVSGDDRVTSQSYRR